MYIIEYFLVFFWFFFELVYIVCIFGCVIKKIKEYSFNFFILNCFKLVLNNVY